MMANAGRSFPSSPRLRAAAIAIGWLLAICGALAPAQVQAKHQALSDQSDEDSQNPPPSNQSKAGHATIIKAEIEEIHDRLTPDLDQGIQWAIQFVFTLSGKNNVTETRQSTWMGSSLHPVRKRNRLFTEGERSGMFGENDGKVVWHVLGEHKLQRIAIGKQYLMLIEVSTEGGACRIDAKFLLQTGFSDIIMKRARTGEEEHFTLPRVERASCTIESP